jgi:hypothetical protein
MKKISICLLLSLIYLSVKSQERVFNKISYGFQLVKFHEEFGFGVHLLSPEYKNLRISVKTNLNWLNHPDVQGNQTWTEFLSNQIGVNYQICITNRINLYSEGGVVFLYPNSSFSDESLNFGGYGVFGFEFFFTENTSRNPSYFIELGGIGTGAVANKIISNPIYSNGFLISVGYRF